MENKKFYQVIPLNMTANANRLLAARDIVSEDVFEAEQIPELIKNGFIKEVSVPADHRKITDQDLAEHPEFVERGMQVGDFYPSAPAAPEVVPMGIEQAVAPNVPVRNTEADAAKQPEALKETGNQDDNGGKLKGGSLRGGKVN